MEDSFFFVKIILLPSGFFNRHLLAFFESNLEEVRILFFFILTILIPKLSTMQTPKFQNDITCPIY